MIEQPAICLDLTNAKLLGYPALQRLAIRQGKIARIQGMAEPLRPDVEELDLGGDWVSPGGVDLQINGALGLAFPEVQSGDRETLEKICQFLWAQGVDGFLPTIVTTGIENIRRSLQVLAEFIPQQPPNTAQILGVHLEGPFLNPDKRGAHPQADLLPLTLENLKQVLGDYADCIRIITLAPELDESGETLEYLQKLGIIVSLGHSQATAIQAQRAFDQGASMVTHAFNAMPSLHHREPGLLGAALVHPQVHCGLIADGQHICPTMLDVSIRVARGRPEATEIGSKLFLVSDALAPLGLPDGTYPWDQRQIQVAHGTARLNDGTLVGTTLPLLAGVQNLATWGLCTVEEAITIATLAPRQALGKFDLIAQPVSQLLRWQKNSGQGLTWQRILPQC
ncbi:MAG: N-acetylglucosamine-6-phosphate deacetylase [Microcoleaceae cyanobacterium]